jgi:hypothetical protein
MAQVEQESVGHDHDEGRRVDVTVHVSGHPTQVFEIGSHATLLKVMHRAVSLAGAELLPPRQPTFDLLHAMKGEHVGPVIEHLDLSLDDYLHHAGHQPHFTIELVRAFRVNTRWDVAPADMMSPREILALPRIHLDYTKYSLYLPEQNDELPLDTPIKIERGTDLEAQADGKYGGGQ